MTPNVQDMATQSDSELQGTPSVIKSLPKAPSKPRLDIGERTPWGRVAAVGMRDGERYYMMVKAGVVSLIPEGDTEVTDLVRSNSKPARTHTKSAKSMPNNKPIGEE